MWVKSSAQFKGRESTLGGVRFSLDLPAVPSAAVIVTLKNFCNGRRPIVSLKKIREVAHSRN